MLLTLVLMGNPLIIINRIVTKNDVGHQNRCRLDQSLLGETNQMWRLVVGESKKGKEGSEETRRFLSNLV